MQILKQYNRDYIRSKHTLPSITIQCWLIMHMKLTTFLCAGDMKSTTALARHVKSKCSVTQIMAFLIVTQNKGWDVTDHYSPTVRCGYWSFGVDHCIRYGQAKFMADRKVTMPAGGREKTSLILWFLLGNKFRRRPKRDCDIKQTYWFTYWGKRADGRNCGYEFPGRFNRVGDKLWTIHDFKHLIE